MVVAGCCGTAVTTATLSDRRGGLSPRFVFGVPLGGHDLKDVLLTPEGYENLTRELDTLRTERRRDVADRSEWRGNSATSPRTRSTTTPRTSKPCSSTRLRSSRSVCSTRASSTRAMWTRASSRWARVVRLRDVDAKETVEYHIVGSAEANPAEHSSRTSLRWAAPSSVSRKGRPSRCDDAQGREDQVQDNGNQSGLTRLARTGRRRLRPAEPASPSPCALHGTRLSGSVRSYYPLRPRNRERRTGARQPGLQLGL